MAQILSNQQITKHGCNFGESEEPLYPSSFWGASEYCTGYINDLPACVHNRVKLYADYVLLYANVDSESDCDALQQDLDSLVQWSHSWLMPFNFKKREFMRITNKNFINHSYYN